MPRNGPIDPSKPRLPPKEYLRAGLYSNEYKANIVKYTTALSGPLQQKQEIMPLPVHYGSWHIKQEIDFVLPFDVLFKYRNNLLHVDLDVPAFTRLRSSMLCGITAFVVTTLSLDIFVERKRKVPDSVAVCLCEKPSSEQIPGCPDDCINR